MNDTSHRESSRLRLAGILALSSTLSWCAVASLYALQSVGLAATHVWVLSWAHAAQDALLVFPLALLAIAAAAWLSEDRRVHGIFSGRMAYAALVAAIFSWFLVPALGLHHELARALGGGVPTTHSFHGLTRLANPGRLGQLAWNLLEGLHDALLISFLAAPTAWVTLVVLTARSRQRDAAHATGAQASAHRTLVSSCIVLGLVVAAVAGVNSTLADDEFLHRATHAQPAPPVPIGVQSKIDGIRIAVQSAQWLRQPRASLRAVPRAVGATSTAPAIDRVYLDVRLKNVDVVPRRIGRRDFRMLGPDGSWGPLAEEFPDVLLEPQEQLHTRLIFEVPERPVELEFAWNGQRPRVHIPLADDPPAAGLFQSICQQLLPDSGWH